MLKAPARSYLPVTVVMSLAVMVCAGLASTASALADGGRSWEAPPTLNGDWASFNRCPVDNPTMLAADGVTNIALCLAVSSPNGSLTVGSLTVPTKHTDLQIGLVDNNSNGSSTVVAPADGAILDEPIEIPNGLQSLLCPSQGRAARTICRKHRHDGGDSGGNEPDDALTLSLESAGDPYDFNLSAGLQVNQPVLSVPSRLHLQNRLLGNRCYIGSAAEPIVVQPENLTAPVGAFESFDANGTPDPSGTMVLIQFHNTQGSSSFAVPKASGCGFMGIFDEAIDANAGLPSPAGKNTISFNEAATDLTGISDAESIAPNDGRELSKNWHSAVLPEEQEEGGGRHGHRH